MGTAYDMIVVRKLHQSPVTYADNDKTTSLVRSVEHSVYNDGSLANKHATSDDGDAQNVRHIQEQTAVSS